MEGVDDCGVVVGGELDEPTDGGDGQHVGILALAVRGGVRVG